MDRRRILLVFAAAIAALGTLLVFLYVRGADTRAEEQFETVEVLTALQTITPGETVDAAFAAGKFAMAPVPSGSVLQGVLTDPSATAIKGMVATTTVYAGEQIIASKFGGSAEASALPIPKGFLAISVNLTDPARVAGFVPSSGPASTRPPRSRSPGCCCRGSPSSASARPPRVRLRPRTPPATRRPSSFPTRCLHWR